MARTILIKTAWSNWYQGGAVDGSFGYVRTHGKHSGHERFNFLPADGVYYGYCPPHSVATPQPTHRSGWTVVWAARQPGKNGIQIVGAYFDATFEAGYRVRDVFGEPISFCVSARSALVIPPELRVDPFRSPIRSVPYMYIEGESSAPTRRKLATMLTRRLADAQRRVEENPVSLPGNATFPSNAHILAVDRAAILVAKKFFATKGWTIVEDLQNMRGVGVDFSVQTPQGMLLIEVKGTSGTTPYCYLTETERQAASGASRRRWRLLMITSVLTRSPALRLYDWKEFEGAFSLSPIAYRATQKLAKSLHRVA